MKVYLDNCAIQRPFDDQIQLKVRLESQAVVSLLALCDRGRLTLVSSEVLLFESNETPNIVRREFVNNVLQKAVVHVPFSEQLGRRANDLVQSGLKPFDATHLASAEIATVDYFCTCDEKFYKRAKMLTALVIVNPIELLNEMQL
jgi:predicted nucleic acid-binding protein